MEIEQSVRDSAALQPPPSQQTQTERFFKRLCQIIFYLQLALMTYFVFFLSLRGIIFHRSPTFHPKKWFPPLLFSVGLSGILSFAWNCFFIRNIKATFKATVHATPILIIIFVFLLGFDIQYSHSGVISLIAFVLVVCGVGLGCYSCGLTHRADFTYDILSRATGTLPARTRDISLVSTIISVLFSGLVVAGIGGATKLTRTRFDILFITILFISLTWTMQVLKNIQLVAISKATYVRFKRDESIDACDAFRATLRHNLGNVCIGSTLLPIIELFRATIRFGECHADNVDIEELYSTTPGCYCVAYEIIVHGNRYGFVHLGAYNKGFLQASRDVWRQFRTIDGLEQLVDFDVTSTLCFFRAVGIGFISALTAGIWELSTEKDHFFELDLTLYAFIIGYFVGSVGSAWLQACVMGYYIAYSEDPQSHHFDDTIPDRIVRQRAQRQARRDRAVVEDDGAAVESHVSAE